MKKMFVLIALVSAPAFSVECESLERRTRGELSFARSQYQEGMIDRAELNEVRLHHRTVQANCGKTEGYCAEARAILQDTLDYLGPLADHNQIPASRYLTVQRRLRELRGCR